MMIMIIVIYNTHISTKKGAQGTGEAKRKESKRRKKERKKELSVNVHE